MTEPPKAPPARVVVPVRLRPEALTTIDGYATRLGLSRSAVIREALAAGLPAIKARADKAPPLKDTTPL